jgi:hypothetical protein
LIVVLVSIVAFFSFFCYSIPTFRSFFRTHNISPAQITSTKLNRIALLAPHPANFQKNYNRVKYFSASVDSSS